VNEALLLLKRIERGIVVACRICLMTGPFDTVQIEVRFSTRLKSHVFVRSYSESQIIDVVKYGLHFIEVEIVESCNKFIKECYEKEEKEKTYAPWWWRS